MTLTLGQSVRSFFEDHLPVQKGLRPTSIRSYRDAVRLFLIFVSNDLRRPITRLRMEDLTMAQTLAFLKHLEQERGNHIRTRNQRLAALRTFFTYLATRVPEMLHTGHQVTAIPTKRVPPPETQFLEREEMVSLLKGLPRQGRHALRDRTLLTVLYNTGARAQEVADLRTEHLDLGPQPSARLHGKGDKWRTCPLWAETARHLRMLLNQMDPSAVSAGPVFCSRPGQALTRLSTEWASNPDVSRPTCSGTPLPYTCWRLASKSTSSGLGSGTRAWTPPTTTLKSPYEPSLRP